MTAIDFHRARRLTVTRAALPAPESAVPGSGPWDWAILTRPRMFLARLVAALGFAALAWDRGAPAVLPTVLAFPLAEALVAWHAGQARHAYTIHDDLRAVTRHLRVLGRNAVLALVPPLLVAAVLLAAHPCLPAARSLAHATVGVLFAGGYGLVLLLASVRRLRVVPVLVALAIATWAWPVAILGVYVAGLVLAAVALYDPRRFGPRAHRR